jgi:uncharacterized phage infection (PIP) family protein YhgE
MSKLTRRFKKNKKNRTIKRGGQSPDAKVKSEEIKVPEVKDERQGVFDIIGNKISNVASSAATTVGDLGLRFVGLERIEKADEEDKPPEKVDENLEKVNEGIEKIGDTASGILNTVENVADKTGAVILDNVNEVLGSDAVNETTEQVAENTAEIVQENLEVFNDALNNPEVKAEVEETIEHIGDVGAVVVEAAEKPIVKAVDVASNAAVKATGAALAGIIKIGTDAAAAVPGVGAVIEVGKMLNDGSKAASAVVEAGSEAVEVASDAFIETKEGIEKGLEVLEENKKTAEEISNRTTKSIDDFENPVSTITKGGRKTRRRLFKRKAKSKRVRFSI